MSFRVLIASLTDSHVPVASYGATEHLGLAYISAALRQAGHEVKMIDAYARNLSMAQVVEETVVFSPQLIGVTVEYNTFEAAVEYCASVKRIFRKTPVCMGGEHATFASEEILSNELCIDFVVRGEGEVTIVEVVDRLSRGEELKHVPGVHFRNNKGRIVKNIDRPAVSDLDTIPFPARDTLEECLAGGIQPALSVLTSRGCHGNCSFCNASKFFNIGGGDAWRARSAENVVAELKYLSDRYQDSRIYPLTYFVDENFVGPGDCGVTRARELAQRMLEAELDIAFEIFCRADSFDGEEETVGLLKQAGLTSALIGLEAGEQRGLDIIAKNTNVQQNLSTLQLFQKYNVITSSSGFIMFNPYSEVRDLIDNADFLLRIGQATLYNMSLRVLLYPGIRLIDRVRNSGLVCTDSVHYEVDGYRFVDPKVTRVAHAVNSIDTEIIRREDATVRHLDMVLARVKDILRKDGNRLLARKNMHALVQPTLRTRAELNALSHGFFIQTVDLANSGWDQSGFERLKERYVRLSKEKLDVLNSEFRAFLKRIEEIVQYEAHFGKERAAL